MQIHTASEGISLARQLETESASFYEELAKLHPDKAESFLTFAKENRSNISQVERAYYGVITDAIEGCYAFNMDPADYALKTDIAPGTDHREALVRAVKIEEKITEFYTVAAEQCRSLMADVPRSFMLVAKKRRKRLEALKSL